jgi:hypothetical protein
MVEAAMDGMEAYLTTIIPGVTPCLSCLFPEKPDWDRRGFSVLGAVSGTLACLTALEAVKLITGFSQPLLSELLNVVLTAIAIVQSAVILPLGDIPNLKLQRYKVPLFSNPHSKSEYSLQNRKQNDCYFNRKG